MNIQVIRNVCFNVTQEAQELLRAALSFGVPQEDLDTTELKLAMIAAQLGSDNIGGAERLAETIATRIVETCECSPGQETELASDSSL
jgi:hypothetical protein